MPELGGCAVVSGESNRVRNMRLNP